MSSVVFIHTYGNYSISTDTVMPTHEITVKIRLFSTIYGNGAKKNPEIKDKSEDSSISCQK